MPITRSCDYCGKQYSRPPALVGQFCSKQCWYASRRSQPRAHRQIRIAPDHPLAGKGGFVGEARAILYERIGPGPHPCNWCGKMVDWAKGERGNKPNRLVADHLNSDPLDDSASNLVPACGRCNNRRSHKGRKFETTTVPCDRCTRPVKVAYKRKTPIICEPCQKDLSAERIKRGIYVRPHRK